MSESPLRIMASTGERISSVDDWFRLAPPKRGEAHWKDDRSAKELAKAWFRTGVAAPPAELLALFESHGDFKEAIVTVARPELVTRFDSLPGGGRHHDLLLVLDRAGERIVVGVEAKADEPLDTLVIFKRDEGTKLRESGTVTNLPERVDGLVAALFGTTLAVNVRLGALRYQLLTAGAGTLVEANERKAVAALLVVHELSGRSKAGAEGLSPTQLAVSDFVEAFVGDGYMHADIGAIHGPFRVHGGDRISPTIPLYVALIRP